MRDDLDDAILRHAARQHGIVARWQLVHAGASARLVDRRLRRRWLTRIHRCVFRVAALAGPRENEVALVLSFGPHALASHHTAAELQRLLPGAKLEPAISVRAGHPDARTGVQLHRVQLAADEATTCDGIPVTTPARTLLDLASSLPSRDLEQALARGLRSELLTEAALAGLLSRYPRRPGAARLRALLSADSPPALTRSEAEQRFLDLMRRAEVATPAANARLRGFEVDFYWREQRLVVEVDGHAYHSSRAAMQRDRARDASLVAAGIRVMRFTWSDITSRPEATIAKVVLALAQAR